MYMFIHIRTHTHARTHAYIYAHAYIQTYEHIDKTTIAGDGADVLDTLMNHIYATHRRHYTWIQHMDSTH